MSLTNDFEVFKRHLVPDPRTTLCDVRIQGGVLSGVADKKLEPGLYGFAAENGIGSKVIFPEPKAQYILSERLFLRASPQAETETVNEANYGEQVFVYDNEADSYRVALARDGYLGWVPLTGLSHDLPEPSHRFVLPRGHIYAEPKVASERRFALSFGSQLQVVDAYEKWAEVVYAKDQTGFVSGRLLWPLEKAPPPARPGAVVSFARRFLECPYVWGGVTAWGLDCSGLIQTVYGAFGVELPRDADQQARCGDEVAPEEAKAGDLLFFPGHVALSLGGTRFLHANAHHMRVTIDDFETGSYGADLQASLTAVRRLNLQI